MLDQIEAESTEREDIKTTKLKIFYTFRFLFKKHGKSTTKRGITRKTDHYP